jgi:hypothetical protein
MSKDQQMLLEKIEEEVLGIEDEAKKLQEKYNGKEACGMGGNTLLDSNNLLLLECGMRQIAMAISKVSGESLEEMVPMQIAGEALYKRVHQLMKKIKHDVQKCFMIINGIAF